MGSALNSVKSGPPALLLIIYILNTPHVGSCQMTFTLEHLVLNVTQREQQLLFSINGIIISTMVPEGKRSDSRRQVVVEFVDIGRLDAA